MTELTKVEPERGLLRPIVKADVMIEAHKEVSELIRNALEEGKDYGPIPGTTGNTLLKPGAERLLKAYGCTSRFTLIDKEVHYDKELEYQGKYDKVPKKVKGFYRYVYKCEIITGDGRVVGDCDGSCSTMESKYASRPNDSENTVIKMAQKRALVGATLNAFGLSDRFTQDVEEKDDVIETKTTKTDTVYSGSDQEEKVLFDYLKKQGVAEDKFREISIKLSGRPKAHVSAIIKEISQ